MPPVRTSTAAPLQVAGSTGPRASAASFAPSFAGAAQGLSQVPGALAAVAGARKTREREAAMFAREEAIQAKLESDEEKEKDDKFRFNMALIEASQKMGVYMAENPNVGVAEFTDEFENTVKMHSDTLGEMSNDFKVNMGRIYAQKIPVIASAARGRKIGEIITTAEKTLSKVAITKDLDSLREAYYGLGPAYAESLRTFGSEVERSNMEKYEYNAVMTAVSDFPEEASYMLKDSKYLPANRVEELEAAIGRSIQKNNQIDAAALAENIEDDLARAWDGEPSGKMVVTMDMVGGDKDKYAAYDKERERYAAAGHMLRMAKNSPAELAKIVEKAGDTLDKENEVAKIAAQGVEDSRIGAVGLLDSFQKEPLRYIFDTADELRAEIIELEGLMEQYKVASDEAKPAINAQMHSTYQDLDGRLIHMQRELGVADDDIKLLLDSEAKQSIAALNSMKPRDGLNELLNIEFRHGDKYWPRVFNQLVDEGMSSGMFMAYNYKDSHGIRETVMEAISNEKGFEQNDRAKVREKVDNDPELAAFAHVMAGGSAHLKSGILSFVESFALQLNSNNPSITHSEAVELANQYLVDDHAIVAEVDANDQEPILVFRDQRNAEGKRTDDEIDNVIEFLDIATSVLDHSVVDAAGIAPGLPEQRLREDTLAGSVSIKGTSQMEAVEAFLNGVENYRWESDGHGVYLRLEELRGGDSFHLRDKKGKKLYIDFDNPFGGGKTNWPTTGKHKADIDNIRRPSIPLPGVDNVPFY